MANVHIWSTLSRLAQEEKEEEASLPPWTLGLNSQTTRLGSQSEMRMLAVGVVVLSELFFL